MVVPGLDSNSLTWRSTDSKDQAGASTSGASAVSLLIGEGGHTEGLRLSWRAHGPVVKTCVQRSPPGPSGVYSNRLGSPNENTG
jgi:hypothetical protein